MNNLKQIFVAILEKVIYFFPVQLLLLQIQRNYLHITFWSLLTIFINGWIARDYGMMYLFLDPEYRGEVNFYSFLIVGFALGAFISAFNISSYIFNSYHFPFLATLSRPFLKFSLNNSIIPLIFLSFYCNSIYNFQFVEQGNSFQNTAWMIAGLIGGCTLSIIFTITYFFTFNKDIYRLFKLKPDEDLIKMPRVLKKKKFEVYDLESIKVLSYLKTPFSVRLTRQVGHYPKEVILKVFRQNHLNAAIYTILIFIIVFTIGVFREYPLFYIPAGSTMILLFTIFLMFFSALHFFLGRWSLPMFIALLLGLNEMSKYEKLTLQSYAYGMNYKTEKAVYLPDSIHIANLKSGIFNNDLKLHYEILDKWKNKVQDKSNWQKKPPIIFVNCSGGGLKSAAWTFRVFQKLDSIFKGNFSEHTYFITGASGGMWGAAYYRELLLQNLLGNFNLDLSSDSLFYAVSRDLLNPMATTIATNDLFIRLQTFTDGMYIYPKDRGYTFERQFNENTGYVLNKPLINYQQYEERAFIPLMVLSPTIINDGRRLLISPLKMSFMSNNYHAEIENHIPKLEDIEFIRFFEKQDAGNVNFLSVLRMNSTFPYLFPSTSLPSNPTMEIMDAGIRDNYGIINSVKYIYHTKNWLNKNVSNVILIQISDTRKIPQRGLNEKSVTTLLEGLFTPLGKVLNNLTQTQEYVNDKMIQLIADVLEIPLEVINFQLSTPVEEEISVAVHLTDKEKLRIKNAIYSPQNRYQIERLKGYVEVKD